MNCPKCENKYMFERIRNDESRYLCVICGTKFVPQVDEDNPPDHTSLGIHSYNTRTGKGSSRTEQINYADHPNYYTIPEAARGPIVKAEWEAFWRKRRK